MKRWLSILLLCSGCLSCADYTPKPKGYLRFDPQPPQYVLLDEPDLPYVFHVSQQAVVELPLAIDPAGWINIDYPELKAKIYCSYLPVTKQTLAEVDRESRALLLRQVKQSAVTEKVYESPEAHVYGSLFDVNGEAASPLQFVLTDSVAHFFRGALYYENFSNTDSLAPVTHYLRDDMIELIQTFRWKN